MLGRFRQSMGELPCLVHFYFGRWCLSRAFYEAKGERVWKLTCFSRGQRAQFDQEQSALRSTGRCRAIDRTGIPGAIELREYDYGLVLGCTDGSYDIARSFCICF